MLNNIIYFIRIINIFQYGFILNKNVLNLMRNLVLVYMFFIISKISLETVPQKNRGENVLLLNFLILVKSRHAICLTEKCEI